MSAHMLAEFVDGSKTAIKMAAVSNATGLTPDLRGMHGAASAVATLNKVFVPQEERLLALGPAEGCKVIRSIPKDTVISSADAEIPEDSVLVNPRKIPDQLCR